MIVLCFKDFDSYDRRIDMLTKQNVTDAIRYNAKRILSRNLDISALLWPWRSEGETVFVWATALFQCQQGLTVDGKFGPSTEVALRRETDKTPVERPVPADPPKIVISYGSQCSNAIIVNGARIMLPDEFVSQGLTASNYLDDGEPRFAHRLRTQPLIHFVLHETCGNTAKGCMDNLIKNDYGVQLIMAPSGHISCHGDLVLDRMVHANQLNDSSYGLEVVNPYSPIYVQNKAVFNETIPAQWWTWVPSTKGKYGDAVKEIMRRKGLTSVPREYVTPTRTQMAAARLLVPWICKITGVQYRFPTRDLSKKKRQIDGLTLKPRGRPGPGVVAHRDFAPHSDGRYMLEDLIGRI